MTAFSCSAPRFEISDLAPEIGRLPSEALAEVNRDVFGLEAPSPEDESIIATLQRLDEALCCIAEKPELIQATNLCPEYVNSQEFRLMFLRSENFDAKKAAKRMVVYWSEKVKNFGSEKAYRRLTIGDLEPNDVRVIEDGGVIALPVKDEKGRGLIFTDISKWNNQRYVMKRVAFYVAHAMLEDVEIQRKGIVFLHAYTPSFSIEHFDRKVNNRMMKAFHAALPVRLVVTHFIGNSMVARLVLPFVLHTMGPEHRNRVRIHFGSTENVLLDLRDYGITRSMIPSRAGGSLDVNIDVWLEERRAKEYRKSS